MIPSHPTRMDQPRCVTPSAFSLMTTDGSVSPSNRLMQYPLRPFSCDPILDHPADVQRREWKTRWRERFSRVWPFESTPSSTISSAGPGVSEPVGIDSIQANPKRKGLFRLVDSWRAWEAKHNRTQAERKTTRIKKPKYDDDQPLFDLNDRSASAPPLRSAPLRYRNSPQRHGQSSSSHIAAGSSGVVDSDSDSVYPRRYGSRVVNWYSPTLDKVVSKEVPPVRSYFSPESSTASLWRERYPRSQSSTEFRYSNAQLFQNTGRMDSECIPPFSRSNSPAQSANPRMQSQSGALASQDWVVLSKSNGDANSWCGTASTSSKDSSSLNIPVWSPPSAGLRRIGTTGALQSWRPSHSYSRNTHTSKVNADTGRQSSPSFSLSNTDRGRVASSPVCTHGRDYTVYATDPTQFIHGHEMIQRRHTPGNCEECTQGMGFPFGTPSQTRRGRELGSPAHSLTRTGSKSSRSFIRMDSVDEENEDEEEAWREMSLRRARFANLRSPPQQGQAVVGKQEQRTRPSESQPHFGKADVRKDSSVTPVKILDSVSSDRTSNPDDFVAKQCRPNPLNVVKDEDSDRLPPLLPRSPLRVVGKGLPFPPSNNRPPTNSSGESLGSTLGPKDSEQTETETRGGETRTKTEETLPSTPTSSQFPLPQPECLCPPQGSPKEHLPKCPLHVIEQTTTTTTLLTSTSTTKLSMTITTTEKSLLAPTTADTSPDPTTTPFPDADGSGSGTTEVNVENQTKGTSDGKQVIRRVGHFQLGQKQGEGEAEEDLDGGREEKTEKRAEREEEIDLMKEVEELEKELRPAALLVEKRRL